MATNLDPIFYPKSVAVIGATNREESVGRALFSNILSGGYTGLLYPVNPKYKGILGVKCFPSVLDIKDAIDLAVIIVPSRITPKILRECGKKGVKGAIIVSAGFKEVGGEGIKLEERIKRIAKEYKIRLVGPNCLGLINTNPAVSLNASFARTKPKAGNIAFISQSGALCTAVLDYAKGENIGFSKFVSMGNKADVTELDLLLALRDDPKTDVILMYLENLVNGREFIRIAREITGEIKKRKPILAIKSGRTPQGEAAAASHTGSLTGSDTVYDAIFAQTGVQRVESIQQLFDYALAFATQPLPKGRRTAVITNAGGPGIMATDACVRYGLEMATFEDRTIDFLKGSLPPTASVLNPVDVIGDAQHDRYELALKAVLKDRHVDGAIVILTPQAMTDIEEIAQVIAKVSSRGKKPVLACFMGIVDVSKGVKILEDKGIPHYSFPEAAVRSLANMCDYSWWVLRPRTKVKEFKVNKRKAAGIIHKCIREKRSYLPDIEAAEVLKAYGFPVLKSILARNEKGALSAAKKIGFPVAMKIVSPDIIHKFDAGGVKLNIKNKTELLKAHEAMFRQIKARHPEARVWGVNIQEMAGKGKETIMGMKKDPHFGPILMFGLGGIYVEAIKDVTFRVAPLRELGAVRMINSIRAFKILQGIRGDRPSDIKAIAECLKRLSQLVMDFDHIEELDINPLVVYEKGKGCKVVDTRIVIKP